MKQIRYAFLVLCLLWSHYAKSMVSTLNDTAYEYVIYLKHIAGNKKNKTFLVGDKVQLTLQNNQTIKGFIGRIYQNGEVVIVEKDGVVIQKVNLNAIRVIKRRHSYDLKATYIPKITERIVLKKKPSKGKKILSTLGIIIAIPLGVAVGIILAFSGG